MSWTKLLANVTGSVDEELRLRNEYLVTENRILRSKIKGQLRLKDEERRQLATIGKQLGRKALEAIATIVKPDTILRWHAKLVALLLNCIFSSEITKSTSLFPYFFFIISEKL